MTKITRLKQIYRFIKKHWKPILVIIYIVSPIDIIPDALVPAGFADDALLVLGAIIDHYKKKREKEKEIIEGEVVEE